MTAKCYCRLMATTVIVFIFGFTGVLGAQGFPRGHRDALGPHYDSAPGAALSQISRTHQISVDSVRRWNQIAIDASGLDHTPVAIGETRIFGEQYGPTRSSRAMAIVHIAIFDAVIAINGSYHTYTGISPAADASTNAAIAQAAHDTLIGRDRIPFTFVSDEYNGITRDNNGNVRPLKPRSFNSLSEAEEENGQSRIYLGIHWSFDKSEGISQGRNVADYVFSHAFMPLHASNDRLQWNSLR